LGIHRFRGGSILHASPKEWMNWASRIWKTDTLIIPYKRYCFSSCASSRPLKVGKVRLIGLIVELTDILTVGTKDPIIVWYYHFIIYHYIKINC